jgi:hypothetical protein
MILPSAEHLSRVGSSKTPGAVGIQTTVMYTIHATHVDWDEEQLVQKPHKGTDERPQKG